MLEFPVGSKFYFNKFIISRRKYIQNFDVDSIFEYRNTIIPLFCFRSDAKKFYCIMDPIWSGQKIESVHGIVNRGDSFSSFSHKFLIKNSDSIANGV